MSEDRVTPRVPLSAARPVPLSVPRVFRGGQGAPVMAPLSLPCCTGGAGLDPAVGPPVTWRGTGNPKTPGHPDGQGTRRAAGQVPDRGTPHPSAARTGSPSPLAVFGRGLGIYRRVTGGPRTTWPRPTLGSRPGSPHARTSVAPAARSWCVVPGRRMVSPPLCARSGSLGGDGLPRGRSLASDPGPCPSVRTSGWAVSG